MLFERIDAVLDPEPHSAPLNMALDEVLLQRATVPTLRIYRWRSPAVSFGYFGRYAEVERSAEDREMVRRWTGGGLVPHTRDGTDVTYTLIVPREEVFFQKGALEGYRLVHEQIVRWLLGCGIAASVAPGAADESSGACFASHVRYDVVAGRVKLAGAAQRRTRWGLLHQGSIQLEGVTERTNGSRQSSLLPPEGIADFAKWFAEDVRTVSLTADVLDSAEKIAEEKYATQAWLRKF